MDVGGRLEGLLAYLTDWTDALILLFPATHKTQHFCEDINMFPPLGDVLKRLTAKAPGLNIEYKHNTL